MNYNEGYIVRIDCDPVALFWSGLRPLRIPADYVVGPDGATAFGAGALVNIPDFQQLINGTSERLDFQLSGVSAETLRLAVEESASVAGARVDLGRMDFDQYWQPLGPVEWEATFEARSLSVSQGVAQQGQTPTRTLTLSIASGDTIRARAPFAFFTDADQRRKYPTDAIFSHVAEIGSGVTRRTGPADAF